MPRQADFRQANGASVGVSGKTNEGKDKGPERRGSQSEGRSFVGWESAEKTETAGHRQVEEILMTEGFRLKVGRLKRS